MTATRPFRAFVSYCHADRPFAAWLQRRLEAYRLPRRLAGQLAPLPGQAPGRLGPIFRDRADLSAAQDLSAAVREAIAASSALVVVASPDAVGSHWVAREIALFRELHPDAPILVALARGEPADALPEALRAAEAEPLAADFRKQGDGRRLAFLKIVAGLAEVPLDALVQRDAQRQMRRVTAVTLGAVTLVVIMAALLVVALRARVEAERQRAEAEGLVEYMLTDLREGIQGVGQFRFLDQLNARAMAFYTAQGDLTRLPDDSLERRARVLHAMGEDDIKRDRIAEAYSDFVEAHRSTAAALARNPDAPSAIFAHAQSEYWLGRVAERRRDWPAALRRYRTYAAAGKRLAAMQPANPDYMMEAGWGELALGEIRLQAREKPDFGEPEIRRALAWFERANAARPNDGGIQDELANGYAWLADSYYLKGDYPRSLEARRHELAGKLVIAARDPQNNAARFQAAKARYAVAANLQKLGRQREARPLLAEAHRDLSQLVRLEPGNGEWRRIFVRIETAIEQGR